MWVLSQDSTNLIQCSCLRVLGCFVMGDNNTISVTLGEYDSHEEAKKALVTIGKSYNSDCISYNDGSARIDHDVIFMPGLK